MGWRNGAYATVWAHKDKDGNDRVVDSISDRLTSARISISRKDKNTGKYNTEFSKFVKFAGTSAARKALQLQERDRIRLLEVEYYEEPGKVKGEYYQNWMVYDFEIQERDRDFTQQNAQPTPSVDEGYDEDDSHLPF